MHKTRVPKLRVPFDIIGSRAAVVEQDSQEEVAQCVEAYVRTPFGSRIDEPEYGLTDLVFREGDVDTARLERELNEWEPRAAFTLSEEYIEEHVRTIHLNLNRQET